jgi:hypothetical protein
MPKLNFGVFLQALGIERQHIDITRGRLAFPLSIAIFTGDDVNFDRISSCEDTGPEAESWFSANLSTVSYYFSTHPLLKILELDRGHPTPF